MQVVQSCQMESTLRVAGGWVRDKLLATEAFRRESRPYSPFSPVARSTNGDGVERLTSKFLTRHPASITAGRKPASAVSSAVPSSLSSSASLTPVKQPVDIDIALDDMLGREFAEKLNDWLEENGRKTHSVGVVLKNPEKSKHLETATMKCGKFWIDFVNLRAEEYTEDSRIPDLMRIGTPEEDAYRRDLTINALFYNINTGAVEDMTGRGLNDLKQGLISTPLHPLTTLLDDPLRVLRSVRFAARLRFTIDNSLREAALDSRVRAALAQKVARERIGSEVDLMLRSPDPVGAIRLLINLGLAATVFPMDCCFDDAGGLIPNCDDQRSAVLQHGLTLLSTVHDYVVESKLSPPRWCEARWATSWSSNGFHDHMLMDDGEGRRLLWYASFLKPLRDAKQNSSAKADVRGRGKKSNRSLVTKIVADELKRPIRDAESIERIIKAADDFTRLMNGGCDKSAMAVLLSDVRVDYSGTISADDSTNEDSTIGPVTVSCSMAGSEVNCAEETDTIWLHAMEFRLLCSKVLDRVGSLWRAALVLSLSQQLAKINNNELNYAIEGDVVDESSEGVRRGMIEKYDTFASALLQLGLIGIWSQKPLLDGVEMRKEGILPNIPRGPIFKEIMDEQASWITTHPGGDRESLIRHLREVYDEFI